MSDSRGHGDLYTHYLCIWVLGRVSCRAVPRCRGCMLLRGEGVVKVMGQRFFRSVPGRGRGGFRGGQKDADARQGSWESRATMPSWAELMSLSCLLHDGLGATNLPLDLLPGPASSFDGARLELPVRARLLDQPRDPFLAESIGKLAVGVRVCEITVAS